MDILGIVFAQVAFYFLLPGGLSLGLLMVGMFLIENHSCRIKDK